MSWTRSPTISTLSPGITWSAVVARQSIVVQRDTTSRRTHELLVSSLGTLGEGQGDGDVGGSQEQLRSVVGHEGGVSSTFLLGQDLGREKEKKGNLKISPQ